MILSGMPADIAEAVIINMALAETDQCARVYPTVEEVLGRPAGPAPTLTPSGRSGRSPFVCRDTWGAQAHSTPAVTYGSQPEEPP